jgi:hypothetical protein
MAMERFIFLLVLLCVDWAAETPLSPPLSSTESICKCISYRQDIQQCLTQREPLDPSFAAERVTAPASIALNVAQFAAFMPKNPSDDPLHGFMSMQC